MDRMPKFNLNLNFNIVTWQKGLREPFVGSLLTWKLLKKHIQECKKFFNKLIVYNSFLLRESFHLLLLITSQ